MSTDPTGAAGTHPDLRPLLIGALDTMREQAASNASAGLKSGVPPEVSADAMTVRCQRTWRDFALPGSAFDMTGLSAGIVQFEAGGKHYSYFVESALQGDRPEWSWAGLSGGEVSKRHLDRAGGFMLAGGSYACIGQLRRSPGRIVRWLQRLFPSRTTDRIEVEHADGTRHSAGFADDDGCIVLAPVVSPVSYDDHVIVRRLSAKGTVLSEERAWVGDGGPPPPEVMQQLAR